MCCSTGFGEIAVVGLVVFDALTVVAGGVTGLVEGISAALLPVPHDTSTSVRMKNVDSRAKVLTLVRGWTNDISSG